MVSDVTIGEIIAGASAVEDIGWHIMEQTSFDIMFEAPGPKSGDFKSRCHRALVAKLNDEPCCVTATRVDGKSTTMWLTTNHPSHSLGHAFELLAWAAVAAVNATDQIC
jgi:hypothetical protein